MRKIDCTICQCLWKLNKSLYTIHVFYYASNPDMLSPILYKNLSYIEQPNISSRHEHAVDFLVLELGICQTSTEEPCLKIEHGKVAISLYTVTNFLFCGVQSPFAFSLFPPKDNWSPKVPVSLMLHHIHGT